MILDNILTCALVGIVFATRPWFPVSNRDSTVFAPRHNHLEYKASDAGLHSGIRSHMIYILMRSYISY
jgi:hypothetical protein